MNANDTIYTAIVSQTIITDPLAIARWLTPTCGECGRTVEMLEPLAVGQIVTTRSGHVMVGGPDDAYVAVACEGYWMISPAALGMNPGNWMDWTTA